MVCELVMEMIELVFLSILKWNQVKCYDFSIFYDFGFQEKTPPATTPAKVKADKKKVVETEKVAVEEKKKLTPEEEAAALLEEKLRQQRYRALQKLPMANFIEQWLYCMV
jgi:hypothetical protein